MTPCTANSYIAEARMSALLRSLAVCLQRKAIAPKWIGRDMHRCAVIERPDLAEEPRQWVTAVGVKEKE